jgi:hypothetical protein
MFSQQSRLQGLIEQVAIDQPTMPQLFERLMREGVTIRHGWTRTGKSKGISYSLDNVAFAGNQLGSRYSFPGLQKQLGVSYEPERDDEKLRSLLTNGVSQEDLLREQQQRQLAEALSRSAMGILRKAGHQDAEGRWVYSHSQGNYTIIYSPTKDGLVVSSREQEQVILAMKQGELALEYCQVTVQDLARFQQFERRIEEQQQQRQRGFDLER